jgi:hypothetical protein
MKKELLFILLLAVLPSGLAAQQADTLSQADFRIEEVTVVQRRASIVKSRYSPLNTEKMTGQELCKAACCNLSESFETSASVDVAYSDAATGAKQIRLLGLSGNYVQLLIENTPGIRGLASRFGMEYIPGPWMESIQVSKGTSSVVNGYEALTGQINVEYLKPQTADSMTANIMLSKDLNTELNLTGNWDVDSVCSTGLLLHGQGAFLELDHNRDGMLDMPRTYQFNALNRWYIRTGDYTGQVLLRAIYDRRLAGQTHPAQRAVEQPYTIDLSTRRIEGFLKNGYVFDHTTGMSIGIITAASHHSQQNRYGTTQWNAAQTNAALNAIFQSNFENHRLDPDDLHEHKLRAGISFNYDRYTETLERKNGLTDLGRQEATPGLFAEYTYSYTERLTLLAGVREDWSSRYGFFTTPRMNFRWSPFDWWTLRGSAGFGYRSPNLVADNAELLVSNRITAFPTETVQEKTLNTGATMTFHIPIGKRELRLSGEYYYTRFLDGMLNDLDASPQHAVFHRLHDEGLQYFAHVAQIEADMEVLRGWTWSVAFRYTDTRQSSLNAVSNIMEVRERPLMNRFKGVITTSYQTPLRKWQFDITAQFNGPGRMPDGFNIPAKSTQYYTRNGNIYHKWYPQLLAQITKYFRTWSIYVGAENMTNYTQDSPILGESVPDTDYINPWSDSYDASQVWAPIHGWKLYAGFRWNLERAN